MHVLSHLPHCITTLMHQFMVMSFACSWQSNKMKGNLACEGQINTQTEKQRLININPDKAKAC